MEINDYKEFSFIHFNDVYNINPNKVEPVGGAARFVNLVKNIKKEYNSLLLFSGDIFSPSVISSIFKGKHMIPILNELDINVSCIGNHDYDFGIDSLTQLINELNNKKPWLLSNLFDYTGSKPLSPGSYSHIIEINGIKIGFMGLIEYDWVLTQSKIKTNDYKYVDFVEIAKDLVVYFKNNNCDIIIALTHMRNYNDKRLSESVPEIDFILGGHDHMFFYENNPNNIILKSGTDFRELTFNKVKVFNKDKYTFEEVFKKFSSPEKMNVFIEKDKYILNVNTKSIQVTKNIEEDEVIKKYAKEIDDKLEEKFKQVIGRLFNEVDARFNIVRYESTSISDFVADLMNIYMDTEVCLINSGSLRIDSIIYPGEITYGTLKRLLPGEYFITRIFITGQQIWKTLENGISKYPALEGRFPIISGISFCFDKNKKYLNRVLYESIRINNQPLEKDRVYTMTVRDYIHQGYDGYDELTKCEIIDKCDEIATMFIVCLKYFELVKSLDKGKFENGINEFEDGSFGFDKECNKIFEYMKQTVRFINGSPEVVIKSTSRILKN